jgi:SIR2-like domain
MKLESNDLARLRSQSARGELVLFTGAGFSTGAYDHSGASIPSSGDLKRELWQLCYPGEAFDAASSLGDLYAASLRKTKSGLLSMIGQRLTVNPDSLPEYYHTLFNFPWCRCYTLNVDDLEAAVARRFKLERSLVTISATESVTANLPGALFATGLEVVHLNGMVPGPPENLTFSDSQYAERIANQEPWYSRCVVDVTSRPVIFIGTVLNESLLWHHMYLRKRRENLGRDLRPTSLLITPDLPLPRRDILRDLRIDWVSGTAEEFANDVLKDLQYEAKRGFAFIGQQAGTQSSGEIPLVSKLASERPHQQTEYLLGDEPHWSDIMSGRAVERSNDHDLFLIAEEILEGKRRSTALAITGTAGSGKSSTLMSLALSLSGSGVPVLWVDKDSPATPYKIRSRVRTEKDKLVLAIDDADLFGRELVGLLRDVVPDSEKFLFVFATRSNKLDEVTSTIKPGTGLQVLEHVVPPLTDSDIDGLIGVLEKYNRLGVLTGASMADRRKAFRDQAGRQLLVAMIQATSGENFERKVQDEYVELERSQKYPYALVAVATSLRNWLSKDEILLAQGDSADEVLLALERLTARHLILATRSVSEYRCRHRVIADLVFDKLKELGELNEVLVGLAWALATKVGPAVERYTRAPKFLARVINHDFLLRTIGAMPSRDIYSRLEGVLSWDYHYWLQRGSLEVEAGDIRKAENFLGAARSLGSGDFRVDTAYAYMLMRKAWEAPSDLHSKEYFDEGIKGLEYVIEHSGKVSEYPYHVLGSQGLAWVHRCQWNRDDKRELLQRLAQAVDEGCRYHEKAQNLIQLREDLRKEILLTFVSSSSSGASS